ncbi:MAG: hypothetical protein V3T74_10195 [Gemmatimonadales bacterium]
MRFRFLFVVLLVVACAGGASAADRGWENPVFDTAEEAVAAARSNISRLDHDSPAALRFFIDLTLAEGDVDGRHPSSAITREVVDRFLITHPTAFVRNDVQRRTIERFLNEMPRQRAVLERRLARFGYPEMPGMVYCRLVESVDAFADINMASSDKMTQVGGVTYYCRYIVLPLSYVGEENVCELRRSAALNPSLDVDETIRRWQRDSFANLINTFRHELIHVHTNSALDVPAYSDRTAYPTWFHEGTATYLAADPHSGLSKGYQEFQELFFYLAQRHGVRKLQTFYADVLGGSDVKSALVDVYAISGTEQLFARSGRWHRVKDVVKTGLWIAVLAIVISAFRGADRPYIGGLQVLAALAVGLAVATGLAEHLYGLRGPGVVLAAKLGFGLVAVVIGFKGVRRIQRHGGRQTSSS